MVFMYFTEASLYTHYYYTVEVMTIGMYTWLMKMLQKTHNYRQKQAHNYTMDIYTITVSGVQYKLPPTSVTYVHVTLCTHSPPPQPARWEWRSGEMREAFTWHLLWAGMPDKTNKR